MGQRQVSPLISKVHKQKNKTTKKNYYKIFGVGELGDIAQYHKAGPLQPKTTKHHKNKEKKEKLTTRERSKKILFIFIFIFSTIYH